MTITSPHYTAVKKPSSPVKRKRVSFCGPATTVIPSVPPPRTRHTAFSSSPSWYTADDYRAFKAAQSADVHEILRRSRQPSHVKTSLRDFQQQLRHVFQQCFNNNYNSKPPRSSEPPPSSSRSRGGRPDVGVPAEAVGVERLLTVSMALDRSRRRTQLRRVLLDWREQQQKHKQSPMSLKIASLSSPQRRQQEKVKQQERDRAAEVLRVACERISRSSREFAQHLARSSISNGSITTSRTRLPK